MSMLTDRQFAFIELCKTFLGYTDAEIIDYIEKWKKTFGTG